jgi:hypothetical protein
LTIDLLTRRTERAGRPLDLRPREFTLLEYLMRNPGRVISKTMILSQVWGYNFNPGTNVVDVLVSRLREKIDKDFEPKLLHTVRGVGYVLRGVGYLWGLGAGGRGIGARGSGLGARGSVQTYSRMSNSKQRAASSNYISFAV